MENEITDLKSRLLQLDFKLSVLKNEEKTNTLQLKQMLAQEKELEISISHQEQDYIGPLENIETYLVAQLERSHETLELERQFFQLNLQATSKLMESKLKNVELKHTQVCSKNEAENTNAIKNLSEQLNICEKYKTNLSSEN
ncbi:hypothetical protein B566_EDAN018138, partial [Ephemera danica]